VLVKKTAGGTDILVLAKGTASGNDALPRAAALRLKGGFYRPSDRRARALGLSASSVWLPGEGRALNLASFGLTAVPEGSFGILDGPGAGQTDALREEILRREPLSGHEELSVMETDLGLSGHALEDVSALRFLNTYSGPASTLSGFGSLPAPEDYSGPAETPAALCAGENNTGRLILDSRFGLGLCRDGRFALLADSENSLSVRNMGEVITISRRVQDFCREKGIDERRAYLAGLAMEEMAGNIVEHGFEKDKKSHSVDVRVVHKNEDVILRLKDDCEPFDPGERQRLTEGEDPTKNIGLRIVFKTARSLEYQNILGMNVLTIRL
jgi:anti-sigma regulatory factor (Ser/Thr protein kinase)